MRGLGLGTAPLNDLIYVMAYIDLKNEADLATPNHRDVH